MEQSIRVSGHGTDIAVTLGDEVDLMTPKTTLPIAQGEWVSIAQYLEVGLVSNRNGRPPRHCMDGVLSAEGTVVASHRYRAAGVEQATRSAWSYLQDLRRAHDGAPIVLEVESSRPVSARIAGRDILKQLMEFTDPGKREWVGEFAFAASSEWVQSTIDWSVNSQVNEAIGGMHIGLGLGVSGAHIDFVAPRARWNGS